MTAPAVFDYSEPLAKLPRQCDLLTAALAAREFDKAYKLAEEMALNVAIVRAWTREQRKASLVSAIIADTGESREPTL